MAIAAAFAAWTLITLTNHGDISSSTYANKHLCDEAASIALTKQSLEEAAEAARQKAIADANAKALKDQWFIAHPFRAPKNTYEREIVGKGPKFTKYTHGHDATRADNVVDWRWDYETDGKGGIREVYPPDAEKPTSPDYYVAGGLPDYSCSDRAINNIDGKDTPASWSPSCPKKNIKTWCMKTNSIDTREAK